MRSRVLWATFLLAVLGALVAAATCGRDPSASPARGEASAGSADVVSDAGSATDATRDRGPAPAAAPRRSRARAAAPEPRAPDPAVVEESWFHEPVAQWETEKRIDLAAAQPGVLVAKWIAMSDSGVELERREGGRTLWRVHVEPLGIEHSKYHQEVTVQLDGARVVVESVGAQKIREVRDLATGARTSREVTDVVR